MSSGNNADDKGQVADPGGCHHLPQKLVVRPADLDVALEILRRGDFAVTESTDATLREVIADSPIQDLEGGPPIGVIDVGENPHRAAEYLAHQRRPIEAAPVHALGYEGHGGFMAGAGPDQVKEPLGSPRECEVEGMIAVIDSGLAEDRPDWMSDSHVESEPIDREALSEGGVSHGTFVSSVIRKLAPTYGIAFAAARPDVNRALQSRHTDTLDDPPTHELEVLGAVARLVRRYADDPSRIKALNLSLGATRCGPNDGFLLALQIAIDMWRRYFGYDIPIFAAGGNSPSTAPVYPGAFPWVRSVAAADEKGNQVVWSEGTPGQPRPRPWITDVAPGSKIHGLSGVSDRDTVWWSGSSFATAVATAQSVLGRTFEVDGSHTYWRDVSVTYSGIDGLAYG